MKKFLLDTGTVACLAIIGVGVCMLNPGFLVILGGVYLVVQLHAWEKK